MPSYEQTTSKIHAFGHLKPGWHYGSGRGPSEDVIKAAITIVAHAHSMGFSEMNAFPGVSGEIQVTLYDNDNYYEFTIEPDLSITLVREIGKQEIFYREGLNLAEAIDNLETFAFREVYLSDLWNLSESLTRSTTMPSSANLKVSPSKTYVTTTTLTVSLESLFLTGSAGNVAAVQSAHTLPDFITT
jgi:hypothetical protein